MNIAAAIAELRPEFAYADAHAAAARTARSYFRAIPGDMRRMLAEHFPDSRVRAEVALQKCVRDYARFRRKYAYARGQYFKASALLRDYPEIAQTHMHSAMQVVNGKMYCTGMNYETPEGDITKILWRNMYFVKLHNREAAKVEYILPCGLVITRYQDGPHLVDVIARTSVQIDFNIERNTAQYPKSLVDDYGSTLRISAKNMDALCWARLAPDPLVAMLC